MEKLMRHAVGFLSDPLEFLSLKATVVETHIIVLVDLYLYRYDSCGH